jgi:1-acyl-sn-glycerol-3-phosphate acyltransferase
VTARPASLPPGTSTGLLALGRWIGAHLYLPAYQVRRHDWELIPVTGPLVVVANHSTMIEPQLLFGMLPRDASFLVKEELFRGVAGKALRGIGQIPIRRGAADRTALSTATGVLRAGGAIGVFPEGTRGSGDVAAAQQGAAWLARATGARVQPIATRGTLRPEGSRRRFRPVVDLLAGAPFDPEIGKGRAGLAEGTELIRATLAKLVRELDGMRGNDD